MHEKEQKQAREEIFCFFPDFAGNFLKKNEKQT